MDVPKLLGVLRQFFDRENEPFVVVGGLAMLTYGAKRNTFDCDLLVRSEIRPKLRSFLESIGYRTSSETSAFSNHVHADLDLGRLDILYVDDETARQIFEARRTVRVGDSFQMNVPSANHLIAMKTQSLAANPERRSDVEDLQTLLARPDVDQRTAEHDFVANGLAELYRGLTERIRRQ